MPVPTSSGVSVISIGMLKPRRDQVVAWRGPMLDRALVQMLSDVYWGDLDVLLLDLPPGTGDVAISLGQHLPGAEVVVVTTPQEAAAEVAERAGTMASMMHQRVVGVVENVSFLPCPHCGPEHRLEIFGSGGGDRVAHTLSTRFGYDVPVLGRIPLDTSLREGGDVGKPIVDADPTAPRCGGPARRRGPALGPGSWTGRHAASDSHPAASSRRMFGVGLPEMAVIAFIAVLVFGPDRLPDLARQAGQMIRKARDFADSAGDELRTELGPEFADLELRDLDPRTIVRKHIVEAMEEADREAAAPRPRGQRPLDDGEVPPYDADAT